MQLEAPKNSGELIPFKDHVLLKIKDKWRVQLSLKNCNKTACWELLTHEKYSKIHALLRCEKTSYKGERQFFIFSNNTWEEVFDLLS